MITVIIPTLNEEAVLEATLESVRRAFGGARYEMLVADGGSQDRTTEIADRFGHLIRSVPPRARQLNEAARLARGEILLFLHADVCLPPQAPQRIQSSIEAGAPGGFFAVTFGSQGRGRPSLKLIEKGINLRSRVTRTGTGDQALFVRRDEFERLGGFAEMPFLEDLDFVSRLSKCGPMAFIGTPVEISARRWIHDGPVRTTLRMWGLRLAFYAGVDPERLKGFFKDVRQKQ